MFYIKKLVVLYASLILCSCSNSVSEDEVVGKYVANHNIGKDVLIIENKTYIHIFIDNEGNKYENKNRWNFENIYNNLGISFNSFIFRYRDDITQHSGYWYVELEKDIFGTVKLCFDPDLYYCYIKQ